MDKVQKYNSFNIRAVFETKATVGNLVMAIFEVGIIPIFVLEG
jgi:hypothetical protein